MPRVALLAGALVAALAANAQSQTVDEIVAYNAAARGGAAAWRAVAALRMAGKLEIGRGMQVPFVLEQKRPNKMRLEFVFAGQTAVQAYDGRSGFKISPYLGRTAPEPLSDKELEEAAGQAELDGPFIDYAKKGYKIELLGQEDVDGRRNFKLRVAFGRHAQRTVYVDAETGLETKLEATRMLRGKERRVETRFSDWKAVNGLLVAHRYETLTEGEPATHAMIVSSVVVNPSLAEDRFAMAGAPPAAPAKPKS